MVPAGNKRNWSPGSTIRLRLAMIWFAVILILSMILTIAYVAGRTWG
jgi:hypothetical protein